jgi:hypothetical protein
MSIDYVIDFPCEPKQRFGQEELGARLCLLRAARERPEAEQLADRALEAGFALRPVAFHCRDCPANPGGRSFGCYGVVNLPLSAEAEEWLADLLPVSLEASDPGNPGGGVQVTAAGALTRLLHHRRIRGAVAEARRKQGVVLRGAGIVRRYGRFFRRTTFSSSQLLELILFRDGVEPSTAELILRALAVWLDGGEGEEAEAIFTQPAEEDDDPSVRELKGLLYAMLIACSLETGVRTWEAEEGSLDAASEGLLSGASIPSAAVERRAEGEERAEERRGEPAFP